jgi:hypothetical protein
MTIAPKYPIYVPSKGRYESAFTIKFLIEDKVPFYLVVEPQDADEYSKRFPEAKLLVLPWSDRGLTGLIDVRNWIKEHSIANGDKRHWQLDDNIRDIKRMARGLRIRCHSGKAFRATEDFVDRYTNVAVAGLDYEMFAINTNKPFKLNAHVYSCSLILNEIPHKWRLPYNDDVDLCLQVLADGWCTILMEVFVCRKQRTMRLPGGNTPIYQDDGRLKMAKMLERKWPGVVKVDRRFQRPQHVIDWKKFSNKLIRRTDIDWSKFDEPNEYDLKLVQTGDTVKAPKVQKLLKDKG